MIESIQNLKKEHEKNPDYVSISLNNSEGKKQILTIKEENVFEIQEFENNDSCNILTLYLKNETPIINEKNCDLPYKPWATYDLPSKFIPNIKKYYYLKDQNDKLFLLRETICSNGMIEKHYKHCTEMLPIYPVAQYPKGDHLRYCDFNGTPAISLTHAISLNETFYHFNNQYELHRDGDEPAHRRCSRSGKVRELRYIRHNCYFREGGLPSYIEYAEDGSVLQSYHWTHGVSIHHSYKSFSE